MIFDGDALDVHGEWSLTPVSQTSSPFDGACVLGGSTAIPVANLDDHRSLGEVGTTIGIFIVKSANFSTVDGPDD